LARWTDGGRAGEHPGIRRVTPVHKFLRDEDGRPPRGTRDHRRRRIRNQQVGGSSPLAGSKMPIKTTRCTGRSVAGVAVRTVANGGEPWRTSSRLLHIVTFSDYGCLPRGGLLIGGRIEGVQEGQSAASFAVDGASFATLRPRQGQISCLASHVVEHMIGVMWSSQCCLPWRCNPGTDPQFNARMSEFTGTPIYDGHPHAAMPFVGSRCDTRRRRSRNSLSKSPLSISALMSSEHPQSTPRFTGCHSRHALPGTRRDSASSTLERDIGARSCR
jgi:hypothetical protein